MKILHVLDGYHIGGIETQAYEIIKNLPKGNKSFLINTYEKITSMQDKFFELKKAKKIYKIKNIISQFSVIMMLDIFFFIKKNKINSIIIYPSNKKMIFTVLAARIAGVKNIFMSLQNTLYGKKYSTIIKTKIIFYIFNQLGVFFVPATKAIFNSFLDSNILIKKFKIIYNSCDFAYINKISAKYKKTYSKKKIKNIIMISRLDSIKDQETLLKAFSKLNEPYWKLKIIGDGPKMNSLRKLARELFLNEEEIFYGESKNVPLNLAHAEIFAFSTTEAEGFGKVLIESIAAEVPIIASDVSACRETLFNGKGGLLVPPRDINQWSKNLKELINSKSRREEMAKQAFLLKDYFNSKNIANEWHQLLKKEFKV